MPNSVEVPIKISGWKGLNVRDASIENTELLQAINFDLDSKGSLVKRYGFTRLHNGITLGANAVKLLGYFYTGAISQIIAATTSDIYYSTDGVTWTLLSTNNDAQWGVQYGDNFYIISSSTTITKWTGSVASNLAGSPSGTHGLIFRDRLFVIGAGANEDRLYFSGIADFTSWPGSNFIDVRPGDGDFLVGLALVNDIILVFKTSTTWALHVQGNTSDWTLRQINSSIGCYSRYTIKEIEGLIYFVSMRGVYRTDGFTFNDISVPLAPIFQGRLTNPANANLDSAAWWDEKYIIHVTQATAQTTWGAWAGFSWQDKSVLTWGASGIAHQYYVYHLRAGGWTQWTPASGITPNTFIEIFTDTPTKGLYCGDYDVTGRVYRLDNSRYTDEGTSYVCQLLTKTFDFGAPDAVKRGKWTGVEALGSGSFDITYLMDSIRSIAESFNGTGISRVQKVAGPGFFRSCGFLLASTTDSLIIIYGLTLHTHMKRQLIPLGQ